LEAIHFGGWLPTRDVKPEVVPVEFIVPYPECAGNTVRGLAALGVDTGIALQQFSINIFILAKKIIPSSGFTGRPGALSRIMPIYFASPNGWQDTPINLLVPLSVNYHEFLYLIHTHCLYNIHDAYWNSWCRQFQKIGYVTSGSYLRVYLCLSSDILGYKVQGIIACFSAEPGRVGAVLPEILWWGPHRHVTLRDWYPQMLQDTGWYLLVIPSIPDDIFPELSRGDRALLDALHKKLEADVGRSLLINVLQRSGLLRIATSSHLADDVDGFYGDTDAAIRDRVTAITASRSEEVTVATAVAGG
jgi:hypothetical protein